MKRLPIRGGNRSNGSNAGPAALNLNNARSNANSNIGCRPRFQSHLGQKLQSHGASSRARLKGRSALGLGRNKLSRLARGTEREAGWRNKTVSRLAKTYSDLYDSITGFDNLYDAYLRARRGKRKSVPCRMFERDLEYELIHLQNELIWKQYRTSGYRSFYVTEPKPRKITALKRFRDRIVQQAMHEVIEPIWESRFIPHSYACRPGRGTHAGARAAQGMLMECLKKHGRVYVLKADIRRYFASIDHEILKSLIRKRISDKDMLDLIFEIIDSYSEPGTPGVGLPIGNLTSQLFANIYLDHFDQWARWRKGEVWFARYMDDFVVIHPNKSHLHAFRIDSERFLQDELKLETNHKTSVFPVAHKSGRGLDFLGYHLWPDRRRLRKDSIKRFARRMRKLSRKYSSGSISEREVFNQIQSWVAHARHGEAIPAINKVLIKSAFRRSV